MSTYAVIYIYAAESDDVRDAHRPAHRDFLQGLHRAGRLRVSGPFGADGPAGALLVLDGQSAAEIAELLDGDPFAAAGAIADRSIRSWETVIGRLG